MTPGTTVSAATASAIVTTTAASSLITSLPGHSSSLSSSSAASAGNVAARALSALQNVQDTTIQSFDDDDNEWELGVGNLIIDLDADLERNSTSPISGQHSPNMSAIEHQATVDKGLKMKIKRKSVGARTESKHEIVKNELKMANPNGDGSLLNTPSDLQKGKSPPDNKDKMPKGRAVHKKDKAKDKAKPAENATNNMGLSNGYPHHGAASAGTNDFTNTPLVNHCAPPFTVKSEPTADPYEFNAKVEDRISVPVKKIKLEKVCERARWVV